MKYTTEMFPNMPVWALEAKALTDTNMPVIDRLENIFELTENEIKKFDPRLYYAILLVLDEYKEDEHV